MLCVNQIKTRAVALNPTDLAALGPRPNPAAVIVGCDASGDVLAVGSAVKHIRVGDRVAAFIFGTSEELDGAFGEAVKVHRKSAWVLPEGMSSTEAAAITVKSH